MKGRPPKILRKGIKVRLKNKGAQSKKKGKKHQKYEAPHKEHPKTAQDISNKDIHANHVEAFNASIVHNFIRIYFTTKEVQAVSLGILDKGFSWEEIFMIQKII